MDAGTTDIPETEGEVEVGGVCRVMVAVVCAGYGTTVEKVEGVEVREVGDGGDKL